MLASWMTDNKSSNWSIGLKLVQFMKNRAYHSGIKMTPYKAMFGVDPRVGLATSNLPDDLIATINVEDDLENLTVQKLDVKIVLSRKLQVRISISFLLHSRANSDYLLFFLWYFSDTPTPSIGAIRKNVI